ncbi:MAG TPA: hypothetical protein VJA21_18230, partial [Verrucomicrobiae bacterium]
SLYLTNCLCDRAQIWLDGGQSDLVWDLRNCTLIGSYFRINRWSQPSSVTLYDSSIDTTNINTADRYSTNITVSRYDFNAYRTNSYRTTPTGANDVLVTNFNWQTGPLGNYYLAAGSPLINTGSVTADLVGLYHFTVCTALSNGCQIKETNSIVDLGFHRPAMDTGGVAVDTVWVEDALPAGASAYADGGDSWTWIIANPSPFSGQRANQSNVYPYEHQHYFQYATETLAVNAGDSLIAYVYLDPANVPAEAMLQWFNGSWDHRAYWGANSINWGVNGTPSRRSMGALPGTGQWVRLEVPASLVGLEGSTLSGMAFTLYGGRATWDYAGKKTANIFHDQDGDGICDVLEDLNGNGDGSDDPTSWTNYNSANALSSQMKFQVFTPLR